MYTVKEIYATLQGEGAQTGRPAVFCRFAGCNLWSGREMDRTSAQCRFCDTDFVGTDGPGGGRFASAADLAQACEQAWPGGEANRYIVLTGGEPILQVDAELIEALHGMDFEIAVETNGTLAVPEGIDWICVSPKAGCDLVQTAGNELKLVYPQTDASPEGFEKLSFDHFYLQPMDGPQLAKNTNAAAEYCSLNPHWQLSLQTHKLIGMP